MAMSSVSNESRLTRIAVFYDGNYFSHVSNYYLYQHHRKTRISISGLHQFIIAEVARSEDALSRHCRIVDAHYFRGRLSANEAQSRNALYRERVFDEVLMREGIVSHFLPLYGGGEKGIDVWLALEAFEQSIHKRFDVVALIAGDGDYLPLIRKINTLGTRVMVLGWDFSFTDDQGNERTTRTAQSILDEATYPILMNATIDDRSRKSDAIVNNLFVPQKPERSQAAVAGTSLDRYATPGKGEGSVVNLNNGYGFIKPNVKGDNLFFHYTDLEDVDFNSLAVGDKVAFELSKNDKGPCAKHIYRK
jgi:cold shock CspA family protein